MFGKDLKRSTRMIGIGEKQDAEFARIVVRQDNVAENAESKKRGGTSSRMNGKGPGGSVEKEVLARSVL